MIKLYDSQGRAVLVSVAKIVKVAPAGGPARHGVRSYVKMIDGSTVECGDTPDEVYDRIRNVQV